MALPSSPHPRAPTNIVFDIIPINGSDRVAVAWAGEHGRARNKKSPNVNSGHRNVFTGRCYRHAAVCQSPDSQYQGCARGTGLRSMLF